MFNPSRPKWVGLKVLDLSDFIRTAALFSMLGVLFAGIDLRTADTVTGWPAWITIIALPAITYVAIGIDRVNLVWAKTKKRRALGTEEKPAYHLVFAMLIAHLCLLAWIGMSASFPEAAIAWPWQVDLDNSVQIAMYFGVFAVGYVPLLYGYHLVASEARGGRFRYLLHPEGPTSWPTLGVASLVILALGGGAWAAGNKMFEMKQDFGLIIMGVVLVGFLLFVFAPHVLSRIGARSPSLDTPKDLAGAGLTAHPGHLFSSTDAILVRLFAPISGATLSGFLMPQLILGLILLPLAIMGFYLPPPLGLVPLALAFLLILALGRRWAWVEDDREKALRIQTTRSKEFRVGFSNDLRDEALLGYAWLFILVPLVLRQIQLHFGLFVDANEEIIVAAGLLDWLRFFGTELAKGVPIVDWVDIYSVEREEVFLAKSPAAQHLVFSARLVVDVVIIAALLQAIGIVQRNRAQKRLFENGQIDFFDPFMERDIFQKAFTKRDNKTAPPLREKWLNFFERHKDASDALGRTESYYNSRRLNELYNDGDKRVASVARWLARDLIIGSYSERLTKLASIWSKASAETRDENAWQSHFVQNFSDVLLDATQPGGDVWKTEDSIALSDLLKLTADDRAYDRLRYRAFALLGQQESLHAAKVLAAQLVRPWHASDIRYVSETDATLYNFHYHSHQAQRSVAASALLKIRMKVKDSANGGDGSQIFKLTDDVRLYVLNDNGQTVKDVFIQS